MHGPSYDIPILRGPVPLTHLLLRQAVKTGDRVVDATCGNGKDTLLLAELVGPSGCVWAFDIQEEALARTAQRLTEAGLAERVSLMHASHEQLADRVTAPLNAIIFNLGWLPGGDRHVITDSATTLPALAAALPLLTPAGLLLITCYPGHAGGDRETEAVLAWSAGLDGRQYHVWRMAQQNVSDTAPFCLVIQKAISRHAP